MTIPNWLVGRFVTTIAIIPQDVDDTTGDLTPEGSIPLTGLLDEITLDSTNDTENIVPLDVRQNNEVIIGSGTSMTLVEILSNNDSDSFNVLATTADSYDVASITYTRGGNTYTGFFTVGTYSEGIRRGKSVGTLSVKPCGIPVDLA